MLHFLAKIAMASITLAFAWMVTLCGIGAMDAIVSRYQAWKRNQAALKTVVNLEEEIENAMGRAI